MGFKFRRVDLVGGSDEFPTGTTYELRLQRSQTVLKKVVDALLETNTGWYLDSNVNSTTLDYVSVPCMSGTNTFPGLFLRNSLSGCKLFIAYFGGTNATTDVISSFDGSSLYKCSSTTVHSGLICSIIPANSISEFNTSFNNNFLPSDATRLIGTAYYTTTSGGYASSHAANPVSGYCYGWGIFATPYTISVASATNTNYATNSRRQPLPTPVYCVGRIFGNLVHFNDNAVNSKYGIVTFRESCVSSSVKEGWSGEILYNATVLGESNVRVPGNSPSQNSTTSYYSCGSFSRADGTWINGTDNSNYIVYLITQSPEMISSMSFNHNNGKSFWTPMYMLVRSGNLSTYGVVDGDGIKGFLDTDLFRYVRGDYGQLLDNGKFIIINEPIYSAFAIGWSPDNKDNITGG